MFYHFFYAKFIIKKTKLTMAVMEKLQAVERVRERCTAFSMAKLGYQSSDEEGVSICTCLRYDIQDHLGLIRVPDYIGRTKHTPTKNKIGRFFSPRTSEHQSVDVQSFNTTHLI